MASAKRKVDQHWRHRLGRTELPRLALQFVLLLCSITCLLNSLVDLHSLTLEDILHEQGHNHSKADYYSEHLFLRILCHTLDIAPGSPDIMGLDVDSKVQSEPVTEFPSSLDAKVAVMEEGNLYHANDDVRAVDKTSDSGSSTSKSSIFDAQNEPSAGLSKTKTYSDSPLRRAGLRKRFGNLTGSGGLGFVCFNCNEKWRTQITNPSGACARN